LAAGLAGAGAGLAAGLAGAGAGLAAGLAEAGAGLAAGLAGAGAGLAAGLAGAGAGLAAGLAEAGAGLAADLGSAALSAGTATFFSTFSAGAFSSFGFLFNLSFKPPKEILGLSDLVSVLASFGAFGALGSLGAPASPFQLTVTGPKKSIKQAGTKMNAPPQYPKIHKINPTSNILGIRMVPSFRTSSTRACHSFFAHLSANFGLTQIIASTMEIPTIRNSQTTLKFAYEY
jgi:hypothetical protein